MKHKRLILNALLLFAIGQTVLMAQETISAGGSNASGSGGSVSNSFGQIFFNTNTGTNGIVTQGVQQPLEISIVTETEDVKEISLNCTTYPNPAIDYVTLKIEASALLNAVSSNFQLYDVSGKILKSKNVSGNETTISMNDLIPATYFLKVSINNKVVKTFKISKN